MRFCPYCGNEVQEGSVFCSKCGKSLEDDMNSATEQKNGYSAANNTPVNKKEKKKTPILLGILVFIVAAAVGRFVSGMFLADVANDDSNTGSDIITEDSSEIRLEDAVELANPEYTNVFSERNLDGTDMLVTTEYSVERFVQVSEDGMVDRLEYGYEDDTIVISAETIYYPLAGFTEEQKTQLDLNMKEAFAPAEALGFSEIQYEMGTEYYVIRLMLNNLDNMINIQSAIDAGVIQVDGAAVSLSMEKTTEGLLAAGYIQK